MKLKKIHIQNLRAFEDEELSLEAYTTLVGANGAGKSTILCALNIFFRETENSSTNVSELGIEDFHLRDTSKPIVITLTFDGLSEEAKNTFADYFRQGELTISAVATYNADTGAAVVQQHGQRLAMLDLAPYFDAESGGEKVDTLKEQFALIRKKHPGIEDAKFKDPMRAALRAYEEAHPELCEPITSNDQFYGFSKGSNRLASYVQWVYVPAVKDATKEQLEARNTALGRLLARRVRGSVKFDDDLRKLREDTLTQYQALLDNRQSTLEDLSAALQARLSEWAHPEATIKLHWDQDAKKAVQVEEPFARMVAGEGDFEGELARFGHGLQRSYLLALLQELASADDEAAPTLILGIEEPELYQHPPQARHLAGVLQDLSEGNAQVIVSTHSPYFISGRGFESVRAVRRVPAERKSTVRHATVAGVNRGIAAAKGDAPDALLRAFASLNQTLQPGLNEMFFTPRLVLVEGMEDIAYLTTWMVLTDRWKDYRRTGCHLVPSNGKSELIQPLVVARILDIPTFVIFDADGNDANQNHRQKHERDNAALLRLLGADATTPFPTTALIGPNYTVWPSNLGDMLRDDVGQQRWDQLHTRASVTFGNPGGFGKNAMHIGSKLAIAKGEGDTFPTLDALCERILAFS